MQRVVQAQAALYLQATRSAGPGASRARRAAGASHASRRPLAFANAMRAAMVRMLSYA